MTHIRLENLEMQYKDKEVLRGLDLEVQAGEFLVILGASGEGKTTLLNLVAGLIHPTRGRILFDGKDVTATDVVQRNMAFVFQDFALYPHMTVRENLRFPLENQRLDKRTIDSQVIETLARLHLEDVADRFPAQLSGGQKQRVALGRALVRDPAVFLFDEPLSSLDPQLREHLRRELKELHRQLNRTFLYVTHDQHSAMALGDRIAFLDGGRILQVAPSSQLYSRPRTLQLARFLGSPPINLMDLQTLSQLTGIRVPPGAVKAGVRPEHLKAVPHSEGKWQVDWVQDLGSTHFLQFRIGALKVCAQVDKPLPPPGEKIRCEMDDNHILFFNADDRILE